MADFINLDDYYTTDENGETVLIPFTETKTDEDCHQCIAHNSGVGTVIDTFINMYREYLRQQWFHIATAYNTLLQAVRDWNANKPQIGEDEDGNPIYPEDRPEPEPPVQEPIPTLDEYKAAHQAFIDAAKAPLYRSQLYSLYGMLGSWHRICTDFLTTPSPAL